MSLHLVAQWLWLASGYMWISIKFVVFLVIAFLPTLIMIDLITAILLTPFLLIYILLTRLAHWLRYSMERGRLRVKAWALSKLKPE